MFWRSGMVSRQWNGWCLIVGFLGFFQPYYTLEVPGYDDCALRFLSNNDGRSHVIKIARKLCHRYSNINHQSDGEDINESRENTEPLINLDMMCNAIKTEYNFPDPEIIVRTTSTASVFGFCPWQLRLSEIVFLPDHPSLPYVSKIIPSIESKLLFQDFVDLIAKFNLCEQRFGKWVII